MIFRTTVKDGLIIINTHGKIPDGTPVEVVRVKPPRKKSAAKKPVKKKATGRKAKKTDAAEAFQSLAGIWKDRPDWKGKTTLEIAAELRRKAMGGRNLG